LCLQISEKMRTKPGSSRCRADPSTAPRAGRVRDDKNIGLCALPHALKGVLPRLKSGASTCGETNHPAERFNSGSKFGLTFLGRHASYQATNYLHFATYTETGSAPPALDRQTGCHSLGAKGKAMKLWKWMGWMCVGAMSAGVFLGLAANSIAAQDLPKVYDASMSRDRQIELATSAAPAAVSGKATVYVLGPKGYEKAREGTNGVSCLVGRHFAKSGETTVEPMCFDEEGSRTLLLVRLHEEELRSEGKAEAEIKADTVEGYKDGRYKAPSKPGILYMMSSQNRLGPDPRTGGTISFPPHLMFYAPYMTAKDLGYDSVATMPYLVEPGKPDAMMVVIPEAPSK
jgi:hypothetical protein